MLSKNSITVIWRAGVYLLRPEDGSYDLILANTRSSRDFSRVRGSPGRNQDAYHFFGKTS
jgi:hypothetical protein